MNDFKEKLKEEIKQGDMDETRKIDNKIIASIIEQLSDMTKNLEDKDEKTQIVNRMVNINNLFEEGFDQEINRLHRLREVKKSDKEKETSKIDKKISTGIVEKLLEISKESENKYEQIQIMDRILKLNNMFEEGFDEEIRKLYNSKESEMNLGEEK